MWKPLIAALLLATPALADESWTTEYGIAYWDSDVDGQAIFSMPSDTGTNVRIYLPGFSTQVERGAHWGYWILADGSTACDSDMVGIDGVSSGTWGNVLLTFDKKDYPSSWTAVFGSCFEDLEHGVRADAQ
jgi:hypothetical protein